MWWIAIILAVVVAVTTITSWRRGRGRGPQKAVDALRARGVRAGVCGECEGRGRLGIWKVCPTCHGLGYWHELPDSEVFKE